MHYVIGHPPRGSAAAPTLLYAGKSGSEARAAAAADTTAAEIETLSHVTGVRKRNANFDALAYEAAEAEAKAKAEAEDAEEEAKCKAEAEAAEAAAKAKAEAEAARQKPKK